MTAPSETTNTAEETQPSGLFEPPGGILVWIIVFVEVITFGAGFVVFAVEGRAHAAEFALGRSLLNQPIALANTLILLTGGWCMANGILALRSGRERISGCWIAAAIGTGFAFLALKGIEYAEKLHHGIGLGEDTFFTLYWLLTGFHFLHVFAAVVILTVMWFGIRRGKYHRGSFYDVESSGIFWHMCDLLWLLLYPIIYLL